MDLNKNLLENKKKLDNKLSIIHRKMMLIY